MNNQTCALIEPLESRIAPAAVFVNATTATYTDTDGDHVTVKFSKPILSAANVDDVLTTVASGAGDVLQKIDLTVSDVAASPGGTNITVTAAPTATAGDGVVNIGYINATGFDLGTVKISGDLGKFVAGDSSKRTPGLHSLNVQSLGVQGTATGAPDLFSHIFGTVSSMNVKTDVLDAEIDITGSLNSLTVGGSVTGGVAAESGCASANKVGTVKIGGDLRGGSGVGTGMIESVTTMGNVTIGGSIIGGTNNDTGEVIAFGKSMGAVKIGRNVIGGASSGGFSGVIDSHGSIASVTIGGSLTGSDSATGGDNGEILALGNLGPVKIGGDVRGGSGTDFSGDVDSHGKLASVTIVGSLIGGSAGDSGAVLGFGTSVGQVKIGGDIIGGSVSGSASLDGTGSINAATIRSVFIGGSIKAGSNTGTGTLTDSGSIRASDSIGSITVQGDLVGTNVSGGGLTPVVISARGQTVQGKTTDVAIGSINVLGRVVFANILAGYDTSLSPVNADAQIGSVKIGGNWTASNLVAGAMNSASNNTSFGNNNDAVITGGSAKITSKISSISIGGFIEGSSGSGLHFGFVAEQVGSIKVGGTTIPLQPGPHNDARDIGSTGDTTINEV